VKGVRPGGTAARADVGARAGTSRAAAETAPAWRTCLRVISIEASGCFGGLHAQGADSRDTGPKGPAHLAE